jgi:hypothetical protein
MANAAIISEFNTRGKDISLAGTGFEYLVQTFMLDYAVTRDKGKAHDQALKKMLNLVVTPSQFPNSHPIYKAHGLFGKDEYALIHDDGKIAAGKIIEYVHDVYDYRVVGVHHTGSEISGKIVEQLTGKKSNADLVLEVSFRELYEYIGTSLKYSKSMKQTDNTLKVYSPTVKTLARRLDDIAKGDSLSKSVARIRDASVAAQKKTVAKYHKLLSSTFGEEETRLYYTEKPCRYTPTYEGQRVVAGKLSHGACSYIRDCGDKKLRALFNEMAEYNLKMKHDFCDEFYKTIKAIVAKGGTKKLYKALFNFSVDQLPTVSVSTSRRAKGTVVCLFFL